jgi:type VI secretion system protein ImpJ
MSERARVVWTEGMFLRTQHFQQQDRWVENLVQSSVRNLRGNAWGVSELELDTGLLSQGKIALRRCTGIMPDGSPFAIPDEAPQPQPLEVQPGVTQTLVHLVLPVHLAGSAEIDPLGRQATGARYAAREVELRDSLAYADGTAPVHVAEMHFRLLPDTVQRDAYGAIAVARIMAMQADGTLLLDPEFAPPCLQFKVSTWLASFVDEVQGKLTRIVEERAALIAGKRPQVAADFADLLILQLCNRYLAVTRHLAQQRSAHPEDLYSTLLEFLAEASTFRRDGTPMAPDIEPYRHAQPWVAFAPLMVEVRRMLLELAGIGHKAIQIPLRRFPNGLLAAEVQDRGLFTQAAFFIAVQGPAAPEQIRQRLPRQIKIGPAEEIERIIRSAVPGVPIFPLPTVPREIPIRRNMIYFEFDRQNEYWRRLPQSAGLAIHVTGDLHDGMEMECWAVRNA